MMDVFDVGIVNDIRDIIEMKRTLKGVGIGNKP